MHEPFASLPRYPTRAPSEPPPPRAWWVEDYLPFAGPPLGLLALLLGARLLLHGLWELAFLPLSAITLLFAALLLLDRIRDGERRR